jgi:Protein of unknown function (DUF742)
VATPTKVRPYVITRGRTRSSRGLGVETLLRTVAYDPHVARGLMPEENALYELCRRPQSVVELASKLELTLGMVRVVVDDLSRKGLVQILPDGSGRTNAEHLELLRRVRDGLVRAG